MNNPRPRLSPASLVAALALVIACTQAAFAQEAPKPATPQAPAAAETAANAPAKTEAANTPAKTEAASAPAKDAAPAAKDPAAAEVPAKPAAAAPEKCACESPDEPEAAAPPASSAPAVAPADEPVKQLFASAAAAPPANAAPELFPRLALRDEQQTDPQQKSGSSSTQLTPLTYKQKMSRAAKNAFFSPIGIGRTLVSSIITQYNEDSQPHKTTEDEVADGATRFAINFSRRATRTLLGSGVYPIIFSQDPRYDRAEEGTPFIKRAGHAVSRVFVQRGDGGELQPAVSRWAGSLSASALSNLWERSTPGHDRIGTDATFKRFANSFVSDAINFLFVEFWPDIAKIFKR